MDDSKSLLKEDVMYKVYSNEIRYLPRGNLSKECYRHEYITVGNVPEKRELVKYETLKEKDNIHDWEKIDYYHSICRRCNLIHVEFEMPRMAGLSMNEYLDFHHDKPRMLGMTGKGHEYSCSHEKNKVFEKTHFNFVQEHDGNIDNNFGRKNPHNCSGLGIPEYIKLLRNWMGNKNESVLKLRIGNLKEIIKTSKWMRKRK